jgi:Brp/Blh family beta-carotene 15,15'-monooxygenase
MLALAAVLISFSPPVSGKFQIILLALGVAVLGLPHGSLDLHVLRREMVKKPQLGWVVGLTSAYIAASLVVLALWLVHPPTALLAFLLASAFHFGDVDTENSWREQGTKHALRSFAHGLLPIVVPSFFRAPETAALYNWLLGAQHALTVSDVRMPAGVVLSFVVVVLIFEVLDGFRLGTGVGSSIRKLISVACVTVLFIYAPPLIAFMFYFCFWHSIAHSIDLAGRLDGRSPWLAFGRFAAAAAVPTAAALAACVTVGFWLVAKTAPDKATVQIVFIGLSCLSAPHILLSAWTARARNASNGVTLAPEQAVTGSRVGSAQSRASLRSEPVNANGF